MVFPKGFKKPRALELAGLTGQAYAQLEAFQKGKPWTLQGGYTLIAELRYRGSSASFIFADKSTKRLQGAPIGFLARRGGDAFVVFRGTKTNAEWINNFKTRLIPYKHGDMGKVHDGFMEAYDIFRPEILQALGGLGRGVKLFVTGHSLGAALATLAAADIAVNTPFTSLVAYTFASPRVGDDVFTAGFNRLLSGAAFRVSNSCDIVVAIPFPVPFLGFIGGYFTHVDASVDFSAQKESVDGNHALETYVAALREGGMGRGFFASLFRRRS